MAWIAVGLDDTLVLDAGDGTNMPVEGAVEAMTQLAAEGHRLTVFTSRFAPMPITEKQRLKEEIEGELATLGFPPMEVWTGTTRPAADLFLGHDLVTFDGDWGLALAQMQMMLEERGILPPPPEFGSLPEDNMDGGGEMHEEELE